MTHRLQKDYASRKRRGRQRRFPLIRLLLAVLLLFAVYRWVAQKGGPEPSSPPRSTPAPAEPVIPKAPAPLKIPAASPRPVTGILSQQTDAGLGRQLLDVLESQRPYGAFYLMVDGASGRILAWGQNEGFKPAPLPTYLSNSAFPAASLSKIITAAAALESNRYSNSTLIPAMGSSVTLYRRQLKVPHNYKGRKVSLEKAFASSMNPPMGVVGLDLGGERLKKTAARFGFNRAYFAGLPAQSWFNPPDNGFAVAEAASGFTNEITLSPLHAAAIVRAVLNGEAPETPWSSVIGRPFAPSKPVRLAPSPFSDNTYYGLQRMFESTIKRGSARSSFKNPKVLYAYNRERLRIGGKTGTKDGDDGRYEWFAGYAVDRRDPEKSLVLVCLHINELKGTRAHHPAQAAALLINHWAKRYLQW